MNKQKSIIIAFAALLGLAGFSSAQAGHGHQYKNAYEQGYAAGYEQGHYKGHRQAKRQLKKKWRKKQRREHRLCKYKNKHHYRDARYWHEKRHSTPHGYGHQPHYQQTHSDGWNVVIRYDDHGLRF